MSGSARRAGTLLVAATGGHLEELFRLKDRLLPSSEPVEWVTFEEEQSRSLLAGAPVHYVDYVPPRGLRPALGNLRKARAIVRSRPWARVVSTGSGIAVPFALAARSAHTEFHYIESAARAIGPSLTGRLVAAVPGVRLYTQYPSWASGRWAYGGSLFDGYLADSKPRLRGSGPVRVVVTLGTMRTFGFERAVRAVLPLLAEACGPQAEVLWQVGASDVAGLGIQARVTVPAHEMRDAIASADLVVAHAGIGSALTALDAGVCPVLLPRRLAHHEHVDDHQLMIAEDLERRGLAVSRDPDQLTAADLVTAMSRHVLAAPAVAPIRLAVRG